MTWSSEASKAKKAAQAKAIPPEWYIPKDKLPPESVKNVTGFYRTCGVLNQSEIDIVDLQPDVLLSKLASGSLTALETTIAFCKAAAVAHQLTNCLTEIFFDRAIERAKYLDEAFKKNGNKPVGPLHGCPISLKDQFQIKGIECNMGIAAWLGEISERDSVLVTILNDAGAVLHCRTNVSQALMFQFGETDNYVYGKTCNPYNRTLTCGGSSGGEGALVALHGSVFGVGTDLGGSVRIPACYQGLFGLRPSLHRFPYAGARNTLLGLEGIASALGPLSRSLDGITAFSKSVIDGEPWLLDPKCPEIPWRQDMLEMKDKKPVFGVTYWDEIAMPHPPMRRALSMTVDALKKAGYEVVEVKPFKVAEAVSLVGELYSSDGGEDLSRTFAKSGEPWHPLILTAGMDKKLSVWESWQLNLKKDDFREAYLNYWNKTRELTSTGKPIDGLLLPPSVSTAHVLDKWHQYLPYTAFFNLVDLPAMVIPVNASVDPELDPVDTSYQPASDLDAAIQGCYSPEVYENAPLTVQLVGRRLREEEVIGMTRHVVNALEASKV
ncbi:amidase [Dendrothele bispora CBS 962.96]|uniref:amidase n=1 Tax=Dendrothele bispora (strain CBS 962.96) TaxID=1314807 RepID=A0A4S8LVQ5_DENBC|nr:amidase [Dendrothele bispora CBS 962.96]